jgi:hypothetical protein
MLFSVQLLTLLIRPQVLLLIQNQTSPPRVLNFSTRYSSCKNTAFSYVNIFRKQTNKKTQKQHTATTTNLPFMIQWNLRGEASWREDTCLERTIWPGPQGVLSLQVLLYSIRQTTSLLSKVLNTYTGNLFSSRAWQCSPSIAQLLHWWKTRTAVYQINMLMWQYQNRGVDNHLPNASRIQDWRVKKTNPLTSLARVFSPLTDYFYILGQLFSYLASENSWSTHQFGECLEKLIHTPD